MRNINKELLEATLFSILVFNLLHVYKISNEIILTLTACVMLAFIALSLGFVENSKFSYKLRLYCLVAIAFLIHGYLIANGVFERLNNPEYSVHDGTLISEESYRAILSGRNPYSISYEKLYINQVDYLDKVKHHETNRNIYSPVAFFINFPIFLVTNRLFGFIDMRVTSVICLLIAAFLALKIIKEKFLFLILFLLNPVFIKSIYFGANDIFMLFFLVFAVSLLYFQKAVFATVMAALGIATKLLFLPFVPLYFMYLWWIKPKNDGQFWNRNFILFVLITGIIYLPFVLWNPKDFFDNIFAYNLFGGVQGRPIAGFVGIPQILVKFGFISESSSFPFILIGVLSFLLFLFFANGFLKKFPNLPSLVKLYMIFFVLVLSFSRIVQSDYLSYLSEVLIFLAFLPSKY